MYNRGKGGLSMSGEFRRATSTSLERSSPQPSFYQSKHRFGSIGWGVGANSSTEKYHNKSMSIPNPAENKANIDSLLHSSYHKIGKNPIICKDRHHIRKIDNDYSITGACGFLNLPGTFASHIDKKYKMQSKPFYSMNISFQKK